MTDGCRLQAVKFVESAVDAGVGDEMVDVVIFGCDACLVRDERGAAGEGVVGIADQI